MVIKRMKFIDFKRKKNKAVTADKNANFRNFFQISSEINVRENSFKDSAVP